MNPNSFTPTQRLLYDVLADGQPHSMDELRFCLPDDLGTAHAVHRHLSNMRKLLRMSDRDILCQFVNRKRLYRLIGLISPPAA